MKENHEIKWKKKWVWVGHGLIKTCARNKRNYFCFDHILWLEEWWNKTKQKKKRLMIK